MSIENDDLQFDQAKFTEEKSSVRVCELCEMPLGDTYFKINDQIACQQCKYKYETQENETSNGIRILKSLGLGVPASALGAGIYYGISALTGYEFGLVAIVIGFLVGTAVKIGSGGRGGWAFQTIAVILTYLSISSTYLAYAIEGMADYSNEQESTIIASEGENNSDLAFSETHTTGEDSKLSTQGTAAEASDEEMSFPLAILALFAFTIALPFLAGFENFIGLIIIGIGVYQAWKINKRQALIIDGPYQFGNK